jgi:cytochrome subunit of sulfide dehydrogenase
MAGTSAISRDRLVLCRARRLALPWQPIAPDHGSATGACVFVDLAARQSPVVVDGTGVSTMKRNVSDLRLVIAAAALCLATAPGARAADVNAVMATCASCHGKDGASTAASVPIIGGMSAPYLADTLSAYKKKVRPCPITEVRSGDKKGTKTDMCEVVKDLGDADIKSVADYLAKQKFVRAVQTADAALAAKGQQVHQQNCEKCHSSNGSVADDDAGILAGQWIPYLKEQLAVLNAGKRAAAPKMKPVIEKIDKASLDALANFYGSMK